MYLKKLKEDELETIFPNSGTINLKKMKEEEKKQYILAYNLYRKLFTEYVVDKLELKKYDNKIVNSDLKFKSVNEENMDIYQYCSSNELKFLYIRNNIYIEHLTEKEKEFLMNRLKNNREDLDAEAKQFIENTYEKTIFEDIGKDGKKYITFYGPDSSNFTARNDSLILGMRYDEFDYNGLNDEAWDELHIKQLTYLPEMFYKLVVEQKNKLSVPIVILQYNDFSIRSRNLKNKNIHGNLEEER